MVYRLAAFWLPLLPGWAALAVLAASLRELPGSPKIRRRRRWLNDSMNSTDTTSVAEAFAQPELDPRLARLAARSAAARSGLATNTTATAQTVRPAVAPTRRTRKRHAAKGSHDQRPRRPHADGIDADRPKREDQLRVRRHLHQRQL